MQWSFALKTFCNSDPRWRYFPGWCRWRWRRRRTGPRHPGHVDGAQRLFGSLQIELGERWSTPRGRKSNFTIAWCHRVPLRHHLGVRSSRDDQDGPVAGANWMAGKEDRGRSGFQDFLFFQNIKTLGTFLLANLLLLLFLWIIQGGLFFLLRYSRYDPL